ncbi:MAG: hypothetical protein KDD84_10895, partial [Caldilineaceae bacterium]|nr:hypothetical protein [Caldilineaceae bacterium]
MTYEELRQTLPALPQDVTELSGVPRVLAARLSPQERVARRRLNLPQVEYRLLAGLAMSGWSFRYGLIEAVAAMHGQVPESGTFVRASAHLAKAGLWQVTTVRLTVAVSLVQLTALGQELMAEVGTRRRMNGILHAPTSDDRPLHPDLRLPFRSGSGEPPANHHTAFSQGGAVDIKILQVEPVPIRDDLRAYVYLQVGMWGFRVEIRQRDCERAKVVFLKGRNTWGRQQPVLWCMDERLEEAIAQACLR